MSLKVKYSFIAKEKTKLDSFYDFESPTKNLMDRFSYQLNRFLSPFLAACREKVLRIETQRAKVPALPVPSNND